VVYSLTNASALGLDLARTPGGVEVAGVLLRGLLAPSPDHDPSLPPVRGPADLAAARVRALTLAGPGGPTVVDLGTVEEAGTEDELARTLRRMLRRLGAVSFGTVGDLMALAAELPRRAPRPVVPGQPSLQVVDVLEVERGQLLADAVLAAVVRHRPDPASPVLSRALALRLDPGAGVPAALPPVPAPGLAVLHAADPSPVLRRTSTLLQRIADVEDPATLVLEHGPVPHVWAEHMHAAAWAVETTGRTRLAAAAQLDLLRCLDAAGVDAATCLAGAWNACSAAVQAHVVADVLADDSWTVLTADLIDELDLPPA